MSGLLLLKVLGEELLVSNVSLLTGFPGFLLISLVDSLSSESLLGNESLNLWAFVEGLVSLLDFSSNEILGDIVLLLEDESLSDSVGSLWSESSWSWDISETLDLLLSLLDDFKSNNSEVWSTDASSD